jgi:hypothetical protein
MFKQALGVPLILFTMLGIASAEEGLVDWVAQSGKLLCFAPDDPDKTCWLKHTLKKQDDGSYLLFGERLLERPYNVRRTATIPIKVEGTRYCYSLDEKVMATYKYYYDGSEIPSDEAPPDQVGDSEMTGRRPAPNVCYELLGRGVNLLARRTIDGKPWLYDANLRLETVPTRLMDDSDGYKLRLYR